MRHTTKRKTWPARKRCSTGKIRFETQDHALTALAAVRLLHGTKQKKECRAYRCSVCQDWHLTSRKEWRDEER